MLTRPCGCVAHICCRPVSRLSSHSLGQAAGGACGKKTATRARTAGGSPHASCRDVVCAVVPDEHEGLSAFHGDGVVDPQQLVLAPRQLDGADGTYGVHVGASDACVFVALAT